MFVLCPHCQFLVAVDPASGLPPPRCPRCEGVLMDDAAAGVAAPAQDVVAGPAAAADAAIAAGGMRAGEHAMPSATAADASPVEAASEEVPAPPVPPSPRATPSFATPARAAVHADARPRRWPQAAVIGALALLLVVQILAADRDALAADARMRPAMVFFCAVLRCELAPWREPSAITLLDRNVAADPARPGVLHVTARFRNDARWAQPWPTLVVTLSDVDGRVAGARAFDAREYLGRAPTKNGLASGHVVAIAMDIVEPAPRIVAFTFDFR